MSRIVPSMPGVRYEARRGRKTARSRWFTGRVADRVEGGSMDLWACDYRHPDPDEVESARTSRQAEVLAAVLSADGLIIGGSPPIYDRGRAVRRDRRPAEGGMTPLGCLAVRRSAPGPHPSSVQEEL